MKTVVQYLVKPGHYNIFCQYAAENAKLAKNLYNAALFRIRQTFTGWKKASRSANEQEVFAELANTEAAYPSLVIRQRLSYKALDKIMRVNRNPDFFAGLPMQTAQAVLKQASSDFENWLRALSDYKKHPDKYTGRPRMPKYKKSEHAAFTVTNQDAVIYPAYDSDGNQIPDCIRLKLPGLNKKDYPVFHGFRTDGRLKQVTVKPYCGCYIFSLVIESPDVPVRTDLPNMAGLDLGTDNIAALACTDGSSAVFKGGAVLSENRWFAKKRADAVSDITRGHERIFAESAYLDRLSLRHSFRNKNFMHQCSCRIIDWCLEHSVGVLVIGRNKRWKQNSDMGKRNNQKFVSVPHYQLLQLIEFKAMKAGIQVIEQEESFTSKADISASDFMPVYGMDKGASCVFSGRRVKRGLYRTHAGHLINADCNGAANILRKAVPDAWKGISDFRFLGFPESFSYKRVIGADCR